MIGRLSARIIKLESVHRFQRTLKTQAEIDAEVDAEKKRIRQSLIDGTYQHPDFKGDGLLTLEQERAMWDAFLMDIPEYAPYRKKWG